MADEEVSVDGLLTECGEESLYWCMKNVIFMKDRRRVKGLSQASTVHIMWVVSCEILLVSIVQR